MLIAWVVFSAVMLILLLFAVLPTVIAVGLWRMTQNSRTILKTSARITSVVLVCGSALPIFVLFLFSRAMCASYDFPPVSSADGHLIAQVNEVDCGAIDSFHSSVQLRRQGPGVLSLLKPLLGHGTTVFTVGHDPRLLQLEWQRDDRLVIRYPNDSEYPGEFRCQSRWNEVQVECIPYAPDYNQPLAKMPPVKKVPVRRWFW